MPKENNLLFVLSEDCKSPLGGVYKITFDDGRHYFGKAACIRSRISQHMSGMRDGFSYNRSMRQMRGYVGKVRFEVLEFVSAPDRRTEREKFYMRKKPFDKKRINWGGH